MHVSLRNKIIIGVLGLLALTVLSVGFVVRNVIRHSFEVEFHKRAIFSGFGIVERVRPLFVRQEISGVERILVRYQKERPDIRYILVRNLDGTIIAATAGAPADPAAVPLELPGERYRLHHIEVGEDYIVDVAVPIAGGSYGCVHLGMSERPMLEAVSESIKVTMGLSSGIIILGGILAIIMGKVLTNPIPELTRVSEAVGAGDLDVMVSKFSTDEMGALGMSVNRMIEGLRATRAELLASKGYTEQIITSMSEVLFVVDTDARITTTNQAVRRILGYGEEELVGQSIGMVYMDGETAFRSNLLDRTARGEEVHGHLCTGRSKSGQAVPMSFSAAPMQDADGVISGTVCIARDRSDVERLLHEVDQIYNGSLSAMRVVDDKLNVISANNAFCQMVGVSQADAQGKKCYELFRSERCRTERCNLVRIMGGEARLDEECEREGRDGRKVQVRVLATPFRDHTGKLSGIIEVFSDITQQKELIGELKGKTEELEAAYDTQHAYGKIVTVLNSPAKFEDLLSNVLSRIAGYTLAQVGVVYLRDGSGDRLVSAAAYALDKRDIPQGFALGEGLPGQAARERQMLAVSDVPADYFHISSGTADGLPRHIICLPIFYGQDVIGVLELAGCRVFDDRALNLLNVVGPQLGISIHQAQMHIRTEQLAEELCDKSNLLAAQNEELRSQSEELVALNEELHSQTEELASQKRILEEKTRQSQEADRLKSEFLSNMSHELRTPLNAILGMADLLVSGGLDERQNGYLQVIERNGRNLLNLINDILDLSKIESGRLDFVYTDVPVRSFLEETAATIAPLAQGKKINLKVSAGEDVGSIVCDADKLRQIVTNLLSNAIKFTDEGGSVSVSAAPSSPDYVDIAVADTGIGIPGDSLSSIFEAFRQVDGTTTRRHGGTGLGLSIVKKLTSLMGGRIAVESDPGLGSVFTVTLPRRSKGAEMQTLPSGMQMRIEQVREVLSAHPAPMPAGPGPRNVLIIDDDPTATREMSIMMKSEGYSLEFAENGEVGMEKVGERIPDLILLDLKMPGMDGFAFIEAMGRDPRLRHVPVVLVTAMDLSDAQRSRLKEANVRDVMPKGRMDTDSFLSRVRAAVSPPSVSDKAGSGLPAFDRVEGAAKVLIVEDQRDNLFLLQEALRPGGYTICTAANGQEAVVTAERERPDIILMDIQMPVMDGYEATRRIRGLPGLSAVPIIALTARAMKGEDGRALERGCSDYLSKPVSPAEVLRKVTELLRDRQVITVTSC